MDYVMQQFSGVLSNTGRSEEGT